MLRVASVPASHVYVRHLEHPDGLDSVVRLDDPVPPDRRKVPGGWWPPVMLEPGWVSENHQRFDVFHVQFGFDALSALTLGEVLHELKMHNKPLVYTVHDLRNPHHPEPEAHNELQDVLVAAAHTVITLTSGAAREIERRWGRTAHVLPHPHVLDRSWMDRPRRAEGFVVGVHAKSLRANMDPLALLDPLTAAVAELPHATLQINVHDEVFDPGSYWYAPEIGESLRTYGRYDHVNVVEHPYLSDDDLWEYLSSLSVSVLPYRFGTHSGWLEACHDLGTAVIAPSCGYYREQKPCGTFEFTETSFDASSLRAAVHDAYRRWRTGGTPRGTWTQRVAERTALAVAHARLYREALT